MTRKRCCERVAVYSNDVCVWVTEPLPPPGFFLFRLRGDTTEEAQMGPVTTIDAGNATDDYVAVCTGSQEIVMLPVPSVAE